MKSVRAVLCLLGILFCTPACLRADGGTVRFSEKVGPYRLTVFTQPTPWRAGLVDVSVLVQHAKTGDPMPDARITVHLTLQGHPERTIRHAATKADATNKLLYAALVELPEAGTWHVTVAVEGPAGSAEGAFDLEASEPLPASGDMIWWIAWPALPILLFAWHEARRRRLRTKPPATPRHS